MKECRMQFKGTIPENTINSTEATFSWKQDSCILSGVKGETRVGPTALGGTVLLSRCLLPGHCCPQRLLNWMLALACQRGHLGVVKLLVLTHGADPESYAVRKNEFPVIVRLPLYAAIKSGRSPIHPVPGQF